jgi:hypothetical protein
MSRKVNKATKIVRLQDSVKLRFFLIFCEIVNINPYPANDYYSCTS